MCFDAQHFIVKTKTKILDAGLRVTFNSIYLQNISWIKLRKWKWFYYLVAAQWKLNILIVNTEGQWDGKGQVQVLFKFQPTNKIK